MWNSCSMKVIFIVILICGTSIGRKFEEFLKWKQLEYNLTFRGNSGSSVIASDFVFPDSTSANSENEYIPYNNVPMGVNHYKKMLFITIPRRRPGIPITLSYIDLNDPQLNESPKLQPYPSLEYNTLSKQTRHLVNTLVSVYRVRIDNCHRMWFIDTGMLEYPNNRTQIKRPSIWIIDLKSGQILRKFEIPESIVVEGRGLTSITPDVSDDMCDDAYGYVPDLVHYALHVYSYGDNRMWRFRHNYFSFDPIAGDFSIAGQNFQWGDGIFSITLGKLEDNGFRKAYFHPMASFSEFSVSTKVLRNETNAARTYQGNDFQLLGSRGNGRQSTIHTYDPRSNVIFFNEVVQNGIGCWNTNKPLSARNVDTIHQDPQKMIYPSDINIDMDGTLWVLTNSLPIFIFSTLNSSEYNFRVWRQSSTRAVQNTNCE